MTIGIITLSVEYSTGSTPPPLPGWVRRVGALLSPRIGKRIETLWEYMRSNFSCGTLKEWMASWWRVWRGTRVD